MKHNDLKLAKNPNVRDREAFEKDMFGKMWQADTFYFPHITKNGQCRRVYCVMIIDDHSRLLAVDEAQYLSTGILNDIKMLMNYGYDSVHCFTLILCGESHLNDILRKPDDRCFCFWFPSW